MATAPVLDVQNLKTYFFTRTGVVKAVDGVSFSLMPGETLGIVGESGSGKSMTALSLMRLVPQPAGRIVEGKILFQGEDLVQKTQPEMQDIRGRDICMILQDPMTSLNPVFTIGNQIIETVRQGENQPRSGIKARAIELLQKVKIASPETRMNAYPHQMSGGMRQRVVGAIAIAGAPKVLIADEATTSLDATIQYQYLTLLKELQAETGMSIIFITHDFGIVAKMCDRVAVMYAGRVAENADVRDLFNKPAHPYTEALMRSVPNVDEEVEYLYSIEGQPPALDNLPPGCTFAPRCPYVFDHCNEAFPDLFQLGAGHSATCWKLAGK
ncbi:MAG: ABC transporter ATP-binding protein [Chloroflexi bacterium]|nr:ABC transporter ATP-binding protein [Chloroflexota bacterium]MDA1219015.1 ABC transporter ATP-binding protein [Chloroflexota bacterium]